MSSLMCLFISILLEEETTEKCNAGDAYLRYAAPQVSQQLGVIREYNLTKLDRSSSSSRIAILIKGLDHTHYSPPVYLLFVFTEISHRAVSASSCELQWR